MSFPRLTVLILPLALGLPLLTGGCGVPVAVAAASYGTDGVSIVETGKTGTDHFASMVSKRDCALWRMFRNRAICEDQDPAKPNPYNVNYDEPFRQQSEGGAVEYMAPPHATRDAPVASWDAAAYKPAAVEPAVPTTAVAETTVTPAMEPAAPAPAPKAVKHKPRAKKTAKVVKKLSPNQVASAH